MNQPQYIPTNTVSKGLLRTSFAVVSLALAAATLTGGCASTAPQPTSMRNAQADFSAYKTFGWEPDTSGQPLSLLDQNIRAAITNEMKRKGYEEAAAGTNPDLVISYEAARAEKVKNNPFRIGVGAGSYGGNVGGGVSVGSSGVKSVSEGTLVIHATDPARKAEVWQGRASRELGKGNIEPAVIQSTVAGVLHDLPARRAPP
jgi:hypothetical protein